MSDPCVYFIQADDNGPIKIGFTADDPKRRLSQLQTGNAAALKLLGSVSGTIAVERQFHANFAEWRLQGEWFEPHPTVITGIQEALATVQEASECRQPHCSFCGKCGGHAFVMVAGPDEMFLCDGCIGDCAGIVADALRDKAAEQRAENFPEMGHGG